MSLFPEFIFRTVIVRGLRLMKNDTRYLDQLFRNLDQESAAEMRRFFQTQSIYIDVNLPREQLKLPAIIILLRNETQYQSYLGDSKGFNDVPEPFLYGSEDNGIPVLGGAASASTLSGQGVLVFGPHRVVAATNSTLRIDDSVWVPDHFLVQRHTVHIVSGTGAGQVRPITGNSYDRLLVAPNWQTVPDDTSVFEIRQEVTEVVGEPSSLYTRDEARTLERIGAMYDMNYQVQIIGPNPDVTIYLHAVVKSIFTISHEFLERQGIRNLTMSATDFAHKPEYQPDYAYLRSMGLNFQYEFDTYEVPEDLANEITLILEREITS